MTINTESTHPTAEDQLEAIDEERERIEKEENRLRNGEIALPWPHSSSIVVAIGGLNLVAGGGALALGVVRSLPDRPLSLEEGEDLREDGRFLDLVYKSLSEHQEVLITLLVDSGDDRHLLGYHPEAQKWQVVWEGSDEETAPDPFDAADEWALEAYGAPASVIFDMPAEEGGESSV